MVQGWGIRSGPVRFQLHSCPRRVQSGMTYFRTLVAVLVFAVAMAFVEAAVVVYLRTIYGFTGFETVLQGMSPDHLAVELFREAATIVMLAMVSLLVGRHGWERFGYFIILFGTWDIFYYIWLKATIGWPPSLTEWDVLFLIPVPWTGPVIAPILISGLMINTGIWLTNLYARGLRFRATSVTWVLVILGIGIILYSFMKDARLVMEHRLPDEYWYSLLAIGLVLIFVGFWHGYKRAVQLEPAGEAT